MNNPYILFETGHNEDRELYQFSVEVYPEDPNGEFALFTSSILEDREPYATVINYSMDKQQLLKLMEWLIEKV